MLAVLLLLQAAPTTAIDAERAFAADAQAIGQWAAFRKWAAPDAIMFAPQPDNMHVLTKDWPEPKRAVAWQPAASFLSCDGKVAANTGPWQQPDGTVGFFTTIWVKQRDGGWKWVIDGGDALATPRAAAAEPSVRSASCSGGTRGIVVRKQKGKRQGSGDSPDHTLHWSWTVDPDGARWFNVNLWTGDRYDLVIADRIAAPPPPPKPQ